MLNQIIFRSSRDEARYILPWVSISKGYLKDHNNAPSRSTIWRKIGQRARAKADCAALSVTGVKCGGSGGGGAHAVRRHPRIQAPATDS